MLPDYRGTGILNARCSTEAEGGGKKTELLPGGVAVKGNCPDLPASLQVLVVQGLLHVVDRRHGHLPLQCFTPVRSALGRKNNVEYPGQLITVFSPLVIGGESLVGKKLFMPQLMTEDLPEFLGEAGDIDPAVGGPVNLAGRLGGMGGAGLLPLEDPIAEILQRLVGKTVQGDVEEVGVGVADQPCALVAEQCRDRAEGPVHAAQEIDDRDTDFRRGAPRVARNGHPAGLSLHQEVVSRPGRPLVVPPVRGEMRADDPGIMDRQVLIGDSPLCGQGAPEIIDHRMGLLHQAVKDLLPPGGPYVKHQALLVVHAELAPLVILPGGIEVQGPHLPERVALLARVLDVDDLRSHEGEQLGMKSPGAPCFK